MTRAAELHALAEAFGNRARVVSEAGNAALASVMFAHWCRFYLHAQRIDRDGWPMTPAETDALIKESWA